MSAVRGRPSRGASTPPGTSCSEGCPCSRTSWSSCRDRLGLRHGGADARQRCDDRFRGLARRVVGQREAEHLLPRGGDLLGQRAARVRQAVALEELPDLRCDLRVAVAGQVGEEVVLDLGERLPVMRCMSGLPVMFAEPSIWRRYHSPRVSPSIEVFSKVSTPSGKWPHMITECVHRLRTRFAVTFAASVVRKDGPESSGCTT